MLLQKRISVAMAVYNGERYLKEQVESILLQLCGEDELVVSVDNSVDASFEILNEIKSKDSRLKVFSNPYKAGVVMNFQNAIEKCSGEIIFLSDQDDVWDSDKIQLILPEFDDPKVAVVFHDAYLTDENLTIIANSTFKLRGGPRVSTIGNLFRLSFIGCCMAFRAIYKEVVIPIPTIYRSHDWWIGCFLACGKTKMVAVNKKLIYHRIHRSNVTPKRRPKINYQFQVRWLIILNIIRRYSKKLNIDKQLKI